MKRVVAEGRLSPTLLLLCGLALGGCAQSLDKQPYSGEPRVERLLRMGTDAASGGDPMTAGALYQQAVQIEPNNAEALRGLGATMQRLDKPREAGEAFAAVLRMNPDDLEAGVGYAKAMIAIGRPEAAAVHLEPLVEMYGDDARVLNLAGVIQDLQARHDEAAQLYRRGLAVAPDDLNLRNNLGLSLALAGRHEAALSMLEPLTRGPTSNVRTRQNLALAYGLAGDYGAAERVALLDLDESAVANNLAYYAALREMEPSRARSAALRPDIASASSATNDKGADLILGLTLAGDSLSLGMPPVGSWFVDLGGFATAEHADARWTKLRREAGPALHGHTRLGTAADSKTSLIIGPFLDKTDAGRFCTDLDIDPCDPTRL
ncbi:MAG: tetratricopeptide repeat protein [Geminicoccaceae bacterium]|nr:tetratricopeptide repeat protein [Geminicoccaceae bacterium]